MSERLWNILLDSFWKIFLPGLKVTIPLTVISFSIALVIATAMAMVQFANIKGLVRLHVSTSGFSAEPRFWSNFSLCFTDFRARYSDRSVSGGSSRLSLNEAPTVPRRCVRPWKPFRQASSKPATVSHVVSADHAENYPSAGDAHRFPAAFQLSDRHGKGYFPCRKYHRDGDVYGNAADCSAHP